MYDCKIILFIFFIIAIILIQKIYKDSTTYEQANKFGFGGGGHLRANFGVGITLREVPSSDSHGHVIVQPYVDGTYLRVDYIGSDKSRNFTKVRVPKYATTYWVHRSEFIPGPPPRLSSHPVDQRTPPPSPPPPLYPIPKFTQEDFEVLLGYFIEDSGPEYVNEHREVLRKYLLSDQGLTQDELIKITRFREGCTSFGDHQFGPYRFANNDLHNFRDQREWGQLSFWVALGRHDEYKTYFRRLYDMIRDI